MKGIATCILLLVSIPGLLCGQIERDHRETFLEAESYFLFEEYADALVYYEQLHRIYPENDNINYKIGVCLLNDPYNKRESITYLERAVANINPDYKDESFRETQAPPEAYFYLGNAYRINNQLDSAILTYERFKSIADPDIYDLDLVDEQITACRNAQELMKSPLDLSWTNAGERINSRFSDIMPVLSGDQTKLVYLQKQAFTDAFFYSEKIDGQWSYPRVLNPELLLDVDETAYPTGLNYDGTQMLIYKLDDFIGDIYLSRLVDGQWTPPIRLGDNINTKYWESHACFTKDGKTIYFTSNRKGTTGDLDIYYSNYDEAIQEWGEAVNLGRPVNSKYNEETPFITMDGKTLYFSSYGHFNIGGYDVFRSSLLQDGSWSAPVNMGYPINTTDDDLFYHPFQDDYHAYYALFIDEGFGRRDLYTIEVFTEDHQRRYIIRGKLGIQDLKQLTKPLKVTAVETDSRDTAAVVRPDMQTGQFSFEGTRGSYELMIEGDEILSRSSSFSIPQGYKEKVFDIRPDLLLTQTDSILRLYEPELVDKIGVPDTVLALSGDDTVDIEMGLEKDAVLVVRHYRDSLLLRADTLHVSDSVYRYEYLPRDAENLLALEMTDTAGNISYKEIDIRYFPETDVTGTPARARDTAGIAEGRAPLVTEARETVASTEIMDPELEKVLENFIRLAEGQLKETLLQIDLAGEGISNVRELVSYLKDNDTRFGYSNQEVQDLILVRIQADYLGEYLEQLGKLAVDPLLQQAINDVNVFDDQISSLQDVYDHLSEQSTVTGYSISDVNSTFALLSQRAGVKEILNELRTAAGKELGEFVTTLDPEKAGITSTVELFDLLLSKAERNGYNEREVLEIMFEHLEGKDLRQMLAIMKEKSTAELAVILAELDLDAENIGSISELFAWLLERTSFARLDEAMVYNTFLNLLAKVEGEKMIEELIITELPVQPPAPTYWYWTFGASVVILVLIVLFFRRRKNK